MARPSVKPTIIEKSLEIVEEHGITALTFDSAAEAAGITKRGLLYHFPSKQALVTGIHFELATRMESAMREAVGKEPQSATLVERTEAYIRAELKESALGEMRLLMEAIHDRSWMAPWLEVYDRWFPEDRNPTDDMDDERLRCLVARMAADGAWGYESMSSKPLKAATRQRLIDKIIEGLHAE